MSGPSATSSGGAGTTAQEVVDALANPPGQPVLQRRAAPHTLALARMRDRLGAPGRDLALRSLAQAGADEPSIALLDAWAVVADTVSFYSERIAAEGLLRTAVQLSSVRELARTLGYELRPGVAAQVDLAFTVETAGDPPEVVVVPAATPVQSVPGPGELPQTFETGTDLEARGVWNAIPAVDAVPQTLAPGQDRFWARGPVTLRPGELVLVVSTQRIRQEHGRFEVLTFRTVHTVLAVVPDAGGHAGWTQLVLEDAVFGTSTRGGPTRALIEVLAFRERLRLFGWNAPDPNLLVVDGRAPQGTEPAPDDADDDADAALIWSQFGVGNPLEIDGDHPSVLKGSWLVLEQAASTRQRTAFSVTLVEADGMSAYALNGPVTRTKLEVGGSTEEKTLTTFSRRRSVVHAVSYALAAGTMPDDAPLSGRSFDVAATDPPLPPGRRIVLSGTDATGRPAVVSVDVVSCTTVAGTPGVAGPATMRVMVAAPLPALSRHGLVVHANVATATHGETVHQVLGSGDGRTGGAVFRTRRGPLTYVRSTTPAGARAELVVRVDGVQWTEVENLLDAGPADRVYTVRHDEDGIVRVEFGDGLHGARPPTGVENVTADYRVGIGDAGAVGPRAVSLLLRRPLGIRDVTNPAATTDWAAPETLQDARTNAPLRIRTLDRAVSVADHEDIARAYAGIGPARADLLWDGRVQRVLLSVLATAAEEPSEALLRDVDDALDQARDPGTLLDVRAAERLWFGVRVEVAHDPAYERSTVTDAVVAALSASFGPPARALAAAVTSAAVLVVVRSVAGVTACTVPRMFPLASSASPLPADHDGVQIVRALPGRWEGGVKSAQLLALAHGAAAVGGMTP